MDYQVLVIEITVKCQCPQYSQNLPFSFISLLSERTEGTFPADFYILIIFSYLKSNCSNILDLRNLQEQVKKHSVSKIVHYLNRLF